MANITAISFPDVSYSYYPTNWKQLFWHVQKCNNFFEMWHTE